MSVGPAGPGQGGGVKILLALVIIVVLAWLGYRMFFVNARR